jgi:hypothetical protein
MKGHARGATGRRCLAGILILGLAWTIVVRYVERGQPVRRDIPLAFQTPAECLRVLTSFRDTLLASFTRQSFAGMFTLTGTVISVWRDPELTGIRQWWPWNYRAVRVKSACEAT